MPALFRSVTFAWSARRIRVNSALRPARLQSSAVRTVRAMRSPLVNDGPVEAVECRGASAAAESPTAPVAGRSGDPAGEVVGAAHTAARRAAGPRAAVEVD